MDRQLTRRADLFRGVSAEKIEKQDGCYESDEAVTTLGFLKTSPDQFY